MSDKDALPDDFTPVQALPGMTAFLCDYDGPDGRYSITLHAASEQQILEDHCAELPGLRIAGRALGTSPVVRSSDP